jgi:hypothetical protein
LGDEDDVLSKRRAFIAAERAKPLYARMLWEDVLHHKGIEEDISLTMPHPSNHSSFIPAYLRPTFSESEVHEKSFSPKDLFMEIAEQSQREYSSVLLQQLQMVHFCTVVQGESAYAPHPVPSTSGTLKYVQPTSLLRRIPLTEDTQALQHHLSQKIRLETSRTFQSNPALKFQVVLPNLVSHMQSFKQANPAATVKDFYHWYDLDTAPASLFATIVEDEIDPEDANATFGRDLVGKETDSKEEDIDVEDTGPSSFSDPSATSYLASIVNDDGNKVNSSAKASEVNVHNNDDRMVERLLQQLEVIWRTCDDNAVADSSKSVFSTDKEMTKAMAALERMSVAGLAEELLYLAVCLTWRLLQHSVRSLASEEAQRLAKRAMQPLIHEIQQLHLLRARYPSSTYTSIMKRMFMQSVDAADPISGAAEAKAPPPQGGTAAPSLLLPPSSTNENKVTSLLQLVSCYDRLADCLSRVEDLVHRLVQLSPVKDSSFFASMTAGSDAFEPTTPLRTTNSREKKVTVTRTTRQQSSETNSRPSPSRWWKILKTWLPQARLPVAASAKSLHGVTEYQLCGDDEKVALLQHMRQLTMIPMTVATSASDWYSSDGRELGAPNAKKFVLRALLPQNMSESGGGDEGGGTASAIHSSHNPIDATMVPAVKLSFDEDDLLESSGGGRERSTSREKRDQYVSSEEESDEDSVHSKSCSRNQESDVALTVYCDRQELQAMWEFLEED